MSLLAYGDQCFPCDSLPRGYYRETRPHDIDAVLAQLFGVHDVCIAKLFLSTHHSIVGLYTTVVNYS